MKKHLFAAMAALALVAFPAAGAMAQDMDGDNDVRVDTDNDFDIRPYAGVGLGAFGLEFKNAASNLKKTVFGGYGKLGADIGDYLGVELRIGGTASGTKNNTKLQASPFFSYLGKVQFPATADLKLYALLGGTTAKFKVGNQSKSKTGFSYGVGAEYFLQDTLTVGAEWMQYWTNVKLGAAFGAGAKAKLWGIVATGAYRF
jgi:opacity protein-like surface antigen